MYVLKRPWTNFLKKDEEKKKRKKWSVWKLTETFFFFFCPLRSSDPKVSVSVACIYLFIFWKRFASFSVSCTLFIAINGTHRARFFRWRFLTQMFVISLKFFFFLAINICYENKYSFMQYRSGCSTFLKHLHTLLARLSPSPSFRTVPLHLSSHSSFSLLSPLNPYLSGRVPHSPSHLSLLLSSFLPSLASLPASLTLPPHFSPYTSRFSSKFHILQEFSVFSRHFLPGSPSRSYNLLAQFSPPLTLHTFYALLCPFPLLPPFLPLLSQLTPSSHELSLLLGASLPTTTPPSPYISLHR